MREKVTKLFLLTNKTSYLKSPVLKANLQSSVFSTGVLSIFFLGVPPNLKLSMKVCKRQAFFLHPSLLLHQGVPLILFSKLVYRKLKKVENHCFRAGMSNSNPCAGRMITEKLSSGHSLEIFLSHFCSCDLYYQICLRICHFQATLCFNNIVAGRIGQAIGPPV